MRRSLRDGALTGAMYLAVVGVFQLLGGDFDLTVALVTAAIILALRTGWSWYRELRRRRRKATQQP